MRVTYPGRGTNAGYNVSIAVPDSSKWEAVGDLLLQLTFLKYRGDDITAEAMLRIVRTHRVPM